MVDRSFHRSRRLLGLSPASVEPSPRRCRSNYAGDFQLVATNTSDSDPLVGAIVSQGGPSVSHDLDRSTPIHYRVLFQS